MFVVVIFDAGVFVSIAGILLKEISKAIQFFSLIPFEVVYTIITL